MKNIAILGSTGSIGVNALDVISRHSSKFRVVGLAANSSIESLKKQIKLFKPRIVCVYDQAKADELKKNTRHVKVVSGPDGLAKVASHKDVDIVLICIPGSASLIPAIEAIKAKKQIALASKEILVMAGDIIMRLARRNKVKIIPVDSEHSAIFQCLDGKAPETVKKIILTGSGGPLNKVAKNNLRYVKPRQALSHPKWKMGKKVSVDSATLVNKGFEVIEAMHLFAVGSDKIDVLIHPQAIIHSMVEFEDGNIAAIMSNPDMRLPIQYAFSHPKRLSSSVKRTDFIKLKKMTFEAADLNKFPGLKIAYKVARLGGTMPAVFNAADEELVSAFIDGKIYLTDIPAFIEKVLARHKNVKNPGLGKILQADLWARQEARKLIKLKENRCLA